MPADDPDGRAHPNDMPGIGAFADDTPRDVDARDDLPRDDPQGWVAADPQPIPSEPMGFAPPAQFSGFADDDPDEGFADTAYAGDDRDDRHDDGYPEARFADDASEVAARSGNPAWPVTLGVMTLAALVGAGVVWGGGAWIGGALSRISPSDLGPEDPPQIAVNATAPEPAPVMSNRPEPAMPTVAVLAVPGPEPEPRLAMPLLPPPPPPLPPLPPRLPAARPAPAARVEAPPSRFVAAERAGRPAVVSAPFVAMAQSARDCASPRSFAQQMVCQDSGLAAADRRLQRAYDAALSTGIPGDVLQEDQDDWRAVSEEAARHSRQSLENVYRQRIEELERLTERE